MESTEKDDTREQAGPPLSDALHLPAGDGDWPVFAGPVTVNDEATPQPGWVRATWPGRARLAWHVDAADEEPGPRPPCGPVNLRLHHDPGTAVVHGAQVTHRGSLGEELDGTCDQVQLGDLDARLVRVDFLLVNFPSPQDATALTAPDGTHVERLRLPFADWTVLLDAGPHSLNRQRQLRASSGIGVTHAGRLARADGASFAPAEAVRVLEGLQLAASFALARWVAPHRLHGYDAQDRLVWQEWGARKTEPWETGRLPWWNGRRSDDLTGYVERFAAVYADPRLGRALERLVQYAVTAHAVTRVAVEASLQLAQAGLELLAWTRIRPTMSKSQYDKLHFAGELRQLLQWANISPQVPASLPQLRNYQQRRQAANPKLDPARNPDKKGDAPEILGEIRNDLTHPKLDSLNPEVYTVPDAITDAWRLSLQYLDLLLLHWIDYRGSYLSRLPDTKWDFDVSPVPWQHQNGP